MVNLPQLEKLVDNIDYSLYRNATPAVVIFEVCCGTLDNNLVSKQNQVIDYKKDFQAVLSDKKRKAEVYTTVLFVNGKNIEDHLNEINSEVNYIMYGQLKDFNSSVNNYYSNKTERRLVRKINAFQYKINEIKERKEINKYISNKKNKVKGDYGHELEDYIHLLLKDQTIRLSKEIGINSENNLEPFKRYKYRDGEIDIISVLDSKLMNPPKKPPLLIAFNNKFSFKFIKLHNRVFMYNEY